MSVMSDEWGTPTGILDFIEQNGYYSGLINNYTNVLNDPCNGGRGTFASTSGLTIVSPISQSHYFFVNPPFSQIEDWFTMVHQGYFGSGGYMVIPDWTDRAWFLNNQENLLSRIRFVGRVSFIPLAGQKKSSPTFGTALIAFGMMRWKPNITWPSTLPRRKPRRKS